MLKIFPFFKTSLVSFIHPQTREEALNDMVDLVFKEGLVSDRELFLQKIFEREKIVSTAIGMGVAIPHAKLHHFDSFFIVVAQLKKGIDWSAYDRLPVRLIFMIGGPDDQQTEYLQLLSGLTVALKEEERRKALLKASTPEEIVALFAEY